MSTVKAPAGTVKKVLHFIKGYRAAVFSTLVLAFMTVALTLYIPLLFGDAIDFIISAGNVDIESITEILIKTGLLAGLCALFTWIMNSLNNRITLGVVKDIRNKAYEKINSLPLSYIDARKTGDTVSRIITDADQFSEGLLMGFTQFFTGIITILGTLIFMLTLNWKIALTVVILTPLSLFAARFIARHTYKFFRESAIIRAEQTEITDEFAGGLKTVKAFGKENDYFIKFNKNNDELKKATLKATFYSSITNPSTRFINSLVYAAVALTGAVAVINGKSGLTVGMLVCLLSYANQYTKPFNEISGVAAELQNSLLCASRVIELIEAPAEEPDRENALTEIEGQGNINIEHVYFSYDKKTELIKDFCLNVKKGEKIAIVGPTGSGKTTFINLLMRFYEVDKGRITLDGKDIRDIKRTALRKNFGMVLQDTWLAPGTVRFNLTSGDESITEEEIIKAAKAAHAWSFIKRLPEGLDTDLGENGGSLSAGQKQLLCITRVMLKNPRILILDEATSSIDTRTEIKINRAFNKLTEGKTGFIVAHRLSTVLSADKIVVMNQGRIEETGTHKELIEKNGFYAKLFRSQFPEYR